MSTSSKLWLGFGILTAVLVVSAAAMVFRVRSIESEVEAMAESRNLSATVREIEISMLGHALDTRAYLQSGDPGLQIKANESSSRTAKFLSDYGQLATTARQKEMAARFASVWESFTNLSQSLLKAENRQPSPEDMKSFLALRLKLQNLLADEMRADAVAAYETNADDARREAQAVVIFALILLVAGSLIAVTTSLIVGKGIIGSENEIRNGRERLQVTLASIGDAVITTDTNGRISYLNGVAEKLTGWTNEEAAGQPLENVFLIVNKDTRKPVENPVVKALREGTIVGLANHTVLIAKDGSQLPIDDSAAPIRDEKGNVAGVVLIFRDITERNNAEAALAERSRLVALRADVGIALASGLPVQPVMQNVVEAFVQRLDLAFARVWKLNEKENVLELLASAGLYTHLDGAHSRVKVGEFKIGRIAANRKPHLTNSVSDDSNISDPEWAEKERMVAFAGYPLMLEDRVVGVVAMFARQPISQGVLTELAPLADGIAQFIDRKRTDIILRESEVRKTAMFETTLDCIISIDHESSILEFNAAAEQTFGHRRENVLGRELASVIIPPAYRDGHRKGMAHYLATGKGPVLNNRIELSALRADGSEFPVELTVTRIPIDGPPQFTAYLRDITEKKLLESMQEKATNELRQLAANLSEADRRKNEFLAMLAHELRNPLAPIRNALQILKMTGGNGQMLKSASDMMERQVGQLVRLVDDLLDVSRISRGKIELKRERVDLASVVDHAVEAARPSCQNGGVELKVAMSAEPIYLHGDAARLTQVIGNLLNNSCKFTDKGGSIKLSVEHENGNAVVRVRDTGIGIDPGQIPYIFDMFVQADTSLERTVSGLGIGLTLVRNLVEMHGGTVEAHSGGLGRGSEFVIRFPIMTETQKSAIAYEPAAGMKAVVSRRILVVDDNMDSAESLAMLLEISGHEVKMAHDGVEAVEKAGMFLPEVVLLDIGLPKLNGFEAAREIRRQPWGESMVLIALTGWGQDEDRQKSKDAGFDRHMVKPVDHIELMKRLDELTEKA